MSDNPKRIVMEYTGPWKVELTYFKASGKYYSSGDYISHRLYIWEIFEEVSEMLTKGIRPGLVYGKDYFFTLVEVPDHPHNHPFLHRPTELEDDHE